MATKKPPVLLRDGSRTFRRKTPQPATRAQQGCRLLQLPAEIRNQIWRDVVVEAEGERIDLTHIRKPGLTGTCPQIEAEALPMFFFNGRFTLDITVNAEWRVEAFFDDYARSWIMGAEERAVPLVLRDVYFTFQRPGRERLFVMLITPRANPHFDTPISFCFAEDQSDWPICTQGGYGSFLRKLAKEGREGFTLGEISKISKWVRLDHMFGMRVVRWFGMDRLKRWEHRMESLCEMVPNSWVPDPKPPREGGPNCKCCECRKERKEARKLAKREAKREAKKGGKGQ